MSKRSNPYPNPRCVAAGRRNWLKRGPLTPEGRERLRQSVLARRPWEHSTGPKTAAGKAKVALNGKRAQKGSLSQRELRAELAEVQSLVARMASLRNEALKALTT